MGKGLRIYLFSKFPGDTFVTGLEIITLEISDLQNKAIRCIQ